MRLCQAFISDFTQQDGRKRRTAKRLCLTNVTGLPGGGGYSIYPWMGRCGEAPHTLTLLKTNIADFLTLFKTFILFQTKIDKSIP